MQIHKTRPAETASAAAGTGGIVAALSTHNWLALGVAFVGYVPAVVTLLVANHGIRGVVRLFWSGSSTEGTP